MFKVAHGFGLMEGAGLVRKEIEVVIKIACILVVAGAVSYELSIIAFSHIIFLFRVINEIQLIC